MLVALCTDFEFIRCSIFYSYYYSVSKVGPVVPVPLAVLKVDPSDNGNMELKSLWNAHMQMLTANFIYNFLLALR